jgi:tRNA pseudouridine32 synthase/23S rRNA pseudouridine746 synthase
MQETSKAPNVSYVALPEIPLPYPSILDFLDQRFSRVGREIWRSRLENGQVTDDSGHPVTLFTLYRANSRLCYYREVEHEQIVPFEEKVIFHNDNILIACKPHFLPVIPSGPCVNECLLYRLKKSTGIEDLVPVNRIDSDTAGLVMFSINKLTRGVYGDLFRLGRVRKVYEAIGLLPAESGRKEWIVESRIVQGDPWFISKNEEGKANARTNIRLLEARETLGLFVLEPSTGKQHQLRLHMTMIGSQILNDSKYPVLLPEVEETFEKPLQLLAKELSFKDPVTGKDLRFSSGRMLAW